MRQLFWFLLGAILATSGLTYAQSSWQQQQQTDALNGIYNNSQYQRQQQEMKELGTYHNPYAKPPC